jgi:flagellar biosynthesis protein FlhG
LGHFIFARPLNPDVAQSGGLRTKAQVLQAFTDKGIEAPSGVRALFWEFHSMAGATSEHRAGRRSRVIAVGGAKGGVGKSILAANLGVYLAARGFRTVVVDLDLGAANLHLYLGVWALRHRINDFLDKKFDNLADIAVSTEYDLRLIGGGSSRLGSANLPYARKLKLMRAIKKLDADYIILDLGGDTSYNILDFYLLADDGLVITTCDPAAYLDAYTFIKMALYRRLARLFGAESEFRKLKDPALIALIADFMECDQTDKPRKISDLLNSVRERAPRRLQLVQTAVEQFRPRLVVNMASHPEEAWEVVRRMQKVSRRILSVDVQLAGTIMPDPRIARSAHDLKPEVHLSPYGPLARSIRQILKNQASDTH